MRDWPAERLRIVAATEISVRQVGRPLPNVPLLGGFAALSGIVTLASVFAAIRQKFSGKVAAGNVSAATEAYNMVRLEMGASLHGETQHA